MAMDKINATVTAATVAIFGKPLVINVYRSVLVEAMVAAALKDWRWCSGDYAPYDFSHPTGLRLEVKQTALKQSWTATAKPQPRWDIAARMGYWEDGIKWVEEPGRNADIYVFALHPVTDDRADHRDPAQWLFHVISETRLPSAKSLGLSTLKRLTSAVPIEQLASSVAVTSHELCKAIHTDHPSG